MESVSREKLTADFGEAFLTLQHTYNICMQLLLGKYGLYPGQPQVLFALSKLGAPTQNELAAHLGIGKASAGVSIRRLETGGFVKRIRDKKDTRRCIRLSLTKKGDRLCTMVQHRLRHVLHHYAGKLLRRRAGRGVSLHKGHGGQP